jgi:hypothetical protein
VPFAISAQSRSHSITGHVKRSVICAGGCPRERCTETRTHSLPDYRGCVWRPTGGSLNVFMLTSLLAHPLTEVFGVLPNPEGDDLPEIWIQSWERGYRELSLSDVRDQAD